MTAMPRFRVDRDDPEKHSGLLKLVQVLSFLLVFVGGVVIGLATTSHMNQYFSSQSELYSLINHLSGTAPDAVSNCTIFPVCEKDNCLGIENFVQLTNLTHGMSDQELFWRASMVPKKEDYPFPRVPKVAFMFLTRGPLPMLPLWERFFHGHEELFSIYVHSNPGHELNVSSTSVFYQRQIPSQNVWLGSTRKASSALRRLLLDLCLRSETVNQCIENHLDGKFVAWGSATLSDAERRLLANALLDFSNERFVLLSESCIPVYNFKTVYRYLIASSHSFVESYDEPTRYGRGRYSRNMLPHIKLAHWRKGSQWFEMNRSVAVYVISDEKYYTLFTKYCKPACYPDEHYIPTFLNMFHGSLNSNRTVTWVDWSIGGPHPAMYGPANITEGLIHSIRNNSTKCLYNSHKTSLCYLFARKFAPGTLKPLLNLSSSIMGF